MTHKTAKPHVSAALVRLNGSVGVASIVVTLCAVLQLLVFGCVHFTDMRWDRNEPAAEQQPLKVVPTVRGGGPGQPAPKAPDEPSATLLVHAADVSPGPTPSAADGVLRGLSAGAAMAGTMSAVMLAVLCTLGVAIASAPGVPGVQHAVSGTSWALTLAVAALPWQDVFASVPWPGIWGDYDAMATMSAAVDAGRAPWATMAVMHGVLPALAGAAGIAVWFRFRQGVAEGMVVTSMDELEHRLEQEMETVRKRGPAARNTFRAVAALNQAIGEVPGTPTTPAAPERAAPKPDEKPSVKRLI